MAVLDMYVYLMCIQKWCMYIEFVLVALIHTIIMCCATCVTSDVTFTDMSLNFALTHHWNQIHLMCIEYCEWMYVH